jgi:hypothetical protein
LKINEGVESDIAVMEVDTDVLFLSTEEVVGEDVVVESNEIYEEADEEENQLRVLIRDQRRSFFRALRIEQSLGKLTYICAWICIYIYIYIYMYS